MLPDPREIERIQPVRRRAEDALLAISGVTGVDVGLKEVAGRQLETHAIVVFVAEKGRYEPQDEIPALIEGVPTDVVEATFTHTGYPPAPDATRYLPVQGGAAISPARGSSDYGTLGMLVKDAGTGVPLWLGAYGQVRLGAGAVGYLDAAVCDVGGRAGSASILGLGRPNGSRAAVVGDVVGKHGALTRSTGGVVVSTSLSIWFGTVLFRDQVRAVPRSTVDPPVCQPGAVVNPIGPIFEALGLRTIP